MGEEGQLVHPDDLVRIGTATKTVENMVQPGETFADFGRTSPRMPIVAALLDHLESFGEAKCVVLKRIRTPFVQDVSIVGVPNVAGSIRLTYDGHTTQPFSVSSDAATVRNALGELPNLINTDIVVQLGKSTAGQYLARWIIKFVGKFESGPIIPKVLSGTYSKASSDPTSPSAIVIAQRSIWESTNQIEEVVSPFALGTPTPLRRGAHIVAVPAAHASGFVITACEPRKFDPRDPYGLYDA